MASRNIGEDEALALVARTFGAPVTDPPGNAARTRSNGVIPARSLPRTSETRWWTYR